MNSLSQNLQAPNVSHWIAVKSILRYLKGTSSLGYLYEGDTLNLHGFSDSNHPAYLVDRKNISENVFFLSNGAISRSSKKQSTMSVFSTEAEFKALTTSACEVIRLKRYL
ncbi:hypothetical protein KP509_24G039300 [Ceratopteris richardii]|uniref:Uncharacterized protein n=1 Tax=Ceratopteris richardii TaxID=49495 RepID=A0A8T2RVS3_CERRI|nr:hypothetical protein KP509_24G039300 [Ceratopteris richardii]